MLKEAQASVKRRIQLLERLKASPEPVKAANLAKCLGVSRQVIVQDIALLRAKQEPIVATPNGYLYMAAHAPKGVQKIISSSHSPGETEEELNILVDHGVAVLDVGIEHEVYGRIFRPLGLRTRRDVQDFIRKMDEKEASLLCSLTKGIHFHTLEGPDQESIEQAFQQLVAKGFATGFCNN